MRWIEVTQIFEKIINFYGANQLEIPLVDVLIVRVGRADFNHAVEIALIDEADYFLGDPLEARADELDSMFTGRILPNSRDEILWDKHVESLAFSFTDNELLLKVVKVKLEPEVWWKQVRHGREREKICRELFQTEFRDPSNRLTSWFCTDWVFDLAVVLIKIDSVVHRTDHVIDDFHE